MAVTAVATAAATRCSLDSLVVFKGGILIGNSLGHAFRVYGLGFKLLTRFSV